MVSRTQEEIAGRIRDITESGNGRDLHGSERSRLLEALDFDRAQEWLHDGHPHTEESWSQNKYTEEKLKEEIVSYLGFAWNKANGKRLNSSVRALSHFLGMIWLLGYDYDDLTAELEEAVSNPFLPYYGKPALVSVSERFGFSWRDADNGEWHEHSEAPVELAVNVIGR